MCDVRVDVDVYVHIYSVDVDVITREISQAGKGTLC
jgi:hypothetical protein